VVSESVARLVEGGLSAMKTDVARTGLKLAGWAGLVGAGLIAGLAYTARADEAPDGDTPPARVAEPPLTAAGGPAPPPPFRGPPPARRARAARHRPTAERHAGAERGGLHGGRPGRDHGRPKESRRPVGVARRQAGPPLRGRQAAQLRHRPFAGRPPPRQPDRSR